MRNPIEIDYSHSHAIIQEIGERLRTLLKEERELPASLRLQIDPPVRWRVAAKRCEANDALVGSPPADAKLRRAKGGRLRPDPGVPLTEVGTNPCRRA